MKIVFNDGLIQDTDKLTDKESAVLEAIDNLYKVCKQFNVTAFTRVLVDSKKFFGMSHVLKHSDNLVVAKDCQQLLATIGDWVTQATNGKVVLMLISNEESPSEQ